MELFIRNADNTYTPLSASNPIPTTGGSSAGVNPAYEVTLGREKTVLLTAPTQSGYISLVGIHNPSGSGKTLVIHSVTGTSATANFRLGLIGYSTLALSHADFTESALGATLQKNLKMGGSIGVADFYSAISGNPFTAYVPIMLTTGVVYAATVQPSSIMQPNQTIALPEDALLWVIGGTTNTSFVANITYSEY